MPRMAGPLISLTATLLGAQLAYAQSNRGDVVWSSVVISMFGDRIPLYSPDVSVLTPLGAQEMYNAGSFFRGRYITDQSSRATLSGISVNTIDVTQTIPQALSEVFIQQSAAAFMNGLYPPLGSSNNSAATLSNGSVITGPLSGLQYPQMNTWGVNDPNYYSLMASDNCPGYQEELRRSYTGTAEFQSIKNSTSIMYNALNASFFGNATPDRSVGYGKAYETWDYLNYMLLHNATAASTLLNLEFEFVRQYADEYARKTVGNISDPVMSMTGRNLGESIWARFKSNYGNAGTTDKLNLIFTSWEPMLSLMYLMGMPYSYNDLDTLPAPGSSLVFEMFQPSASSSGSLAPTNATYPTDASNLFVRAFFRNGSDSSSQFLSYSMPYIGKNSLSSGVSVADFAEAVLQWSIMPNGISDWCNVCSSDAIFCTGAVGSSSGSITITPAGSTSHTMSPAVAGVIGAFVTLAVAGLVLLAVMLLGGFRMRRDRPSVVTGKAGLMVHKRRKSDMGGFKGKEKMASDVDLPAGGAPVGASVVPVHNRTSSWEMKDNGARNGNRDSENTFVGEPGPMVSEHAGLSMVKDEDEELGDMKPVKERESF